MGEITEDGGAQTPAVKVGEATNEKQVSLDLYQQMYRQITGRPEQIRRRYSDNLLISFSEIDQLNYKINQLHTVHNVVAQNTVVTVFHERDRKEQFTTFEQFSTYNSTAPSATTQVVLRYNFSILPPQEVRPKEYSVTIRLTSRVAALHDIEKDTPSFVGGAFVGAITEFVADIQVEYSDYVVARGFMEAFDEWVSSCNKLPDKPLAKFLQKRSHLFAPFFRTLAAVLLVVFGVHEIGLQFGTNASTVSVLRFLVLYFGGFFIIVSLVHGAGKIMEDAIDRYVILSYLKLNSGDEKLISDFQNRNKRVFGKLAFGVITTLALQVLASYLASFLK